MEGEEVDELMDWVFGPSLNEKVEQLSIKLLHYQATRHRELRFSILIATYVESGILNH